MATKSKGTRPSEKAQPGTSSTRLEKSRKLAQKRRETYKDLMTGIMESLPFSRDVLTQLDYNSRLRLGLCFLKMKRLLEQPEGDSPKMIEAPPTTTASSSSSSSETVVFQPGVLQELMIEAMDGFLMVLLSDGSIVYLSESIQKHMGIFQSEHMGTSLYDMVLEEDHTSVKLALSSAEIKAHTRIGTKRVSVPCSFFCRMRCSRNKVANTQSKSPGYKVVHTSGYFQLHGSEAYLVALVKPVSPPSILEIRMEGNMFVTHYALDMRCTFFDGRLNYLMGYGKEDLKGKLAFDFHHHDDTEATLECSKGVQARGEGMSSYYRMITKRGEFVWLQTRATMMFDSHTGNPSYIVCMNFIINKEKGLQSLETRNALPAPPVESKTENFISEEKSKAHDPFPIPREDGVDVNPLAAEPGGDLPSESLPLSSSSVKSGKPGKVKVKVEAESPPDLPPLPNTEEPSSTTSPPPPSVRGSSSDVSSWSEVGGRFHDTNHTPLSGGGLVVSECVPDSTSTGETSPEDDLNRAAESGYNSRGASSSSNTARPKNTQSDSGSTGSSSTASPSVIFIHDGGSRSHSEVFSRSSSNSGVSPVQSYTGSSSTVLESEPSVHQDPVIIELPSEPQRPSCRRQSAGGLPVQNASMSQPQNQQLQQRMSSTKQPLSYQSGQQQQPLSYQSGQQQQPLSYQSGQQQQPLSYQSGQQQQPLSYQSGQQQQPLSYQSGQQQQPLSYQSGQQQQPLSYQSGQQQQPLSYQSGQHQSGEQQEPLIYQSGKQQPTFYQSGQLPASYQSAQQQQPISYQGGQQQQPISYQGGQQQQSYQQPLSHHTPSTIPAQHPEYFSQTPTIKHETTSLQYPSQISQTGTGPSWQQNGMGTQQYQYQPQQQLSYQLHHETPASFTSPAPQQPQQMPLQNQPIDGGFLAQSHTHQPQSHTPIMAPPQCHTPNMAPLQSHAHQITPGHTHMTTPQGHTHMTTPQGHTHMTTPSITPQNPSFPMAQQVAQSQSHTYQIAHPQSHTHQIAHPQSHTYQMATQSHALQMAPQSQTHQMAPPQLQTQQQQLPFPQNLQNPTFQAPLVQNTLSQNQPPHISAGLNPETLPLFSTLGDTYNAPTGQQTVLPAAQSRAGQGGAPNGGSFVSTASVPLSHPHCLTNPQTTGVGVAGNIGHVTGQLTPDLVNLTGEDLQILDFIDALGTGSGGGLAQPVPSSHLHTK